MNEPIDLEQAFHMTAGLRVRKFRDEAPMTAESVIVYIPELSEVQHCFYEKDPLTGSMGLRYANQIDHSAFYTPTPDMTWIPTASLISQIFERANGGH